MEAVPKMPMLSFSLKQTVQKSSFSRLKQYIAEFYQEDPDLYSREIYDLETLRAAAYNPSTDINGCNLIKRYYCQLHSLQNRFPIENDHHLVSFNWRDIYSSNSTQSTDLKHDMAVVLYNYGALHTVLGSAMTRTTEEEMKLACTHFQCAAWAFETVREKYGMATAADMCAEILIFMQQISFAQAQECILEKSLIDNRKSIIVAKVTAQIIEYYNTALAALLTGGDDGIVSDVVGSKLLKEWKQYVQFKVQYMTCILLLHQGQHAEEQQKMGERVALYQTAFDRLEEARKESRGMSNAQAVNEALTFVMDVVEAKRKSARNENEFIYHEEVPELSSISSVPGANLVKGIAFSVTDPTLIGEDIFHRLVPIKAHETSSLYSEEKAALLRRIGQKIDAKDAELNKFMESLNIDSLNYDASDVKLPQSLIDRCADLNAKPNAIPDLISKMSSLAEICVDVENMLGCIQELLSKEEFHEKDFQQTMGYRPSSHFIELNREFMKYQEAHSKAGGSNDTLRKAMELHVNNLKILARPLAEVQAAIPVCGAEINPSALNETRNLLNKVNEMRIQRAQVYSQLNDDIQKDDITTQLIAWGDKNVDQLFKTELAKHEKLIAIIEQNIVAQSNILKAFTDAYAKCAHFIKAVADTKHKRETFFSSLIASYDVYDDLLGKSLKGLEFYKKLQSNIHKLSARVRSACDVNEEERQQRIESLNKKVANANANVAPQQKSQPTATSIVSHSTSVGPPSLPVSNQDIAASMPKLSEYETYEIYRNPSIRPTPIGQENTAISSTCLTSMIGSVAYDSKQIVPNATAVSNTPYNYATATSVSYAMPTKDGYNASNYTAPVSLQFKGTHAGYDMSGTNNAGYVNPIYSNFPTSAPTSYPPAYYKGDEQPTNTSYTHPSVPKHIEPSTYRAPEQPPPVPSPQSFDGRVSYSYQQPSESSVPSSNVYSTMQYVQPAEPSLPTYSTNTVSYNDQQYQTYSQYPSGMTNSQVNTSLPYPQTSIPSYSYAEPNYATSQQQPVSSVNNSTYNYSSQSVYSQPQQPTQYMSYHQPMPSANVPVDQMSTIQNDASIYSAGNVYYNPNTPGNVQQYETQNFQPSYQVAGGNSQYYTETASMPAPATDIQYTVPNDNTNYSNVNYNPNLSNTNYNYNAIHSTDQTYNAGTSQPNYATTPNVIPNPTPAPTSIAPQQTNQAKPKSKIDLLSDLDNISIAAPTLQPIKSDSILMPNKTDETIAPAEPLAAAKPIEIQTVSAKPYEASSTLTIAVTTTTTTIPSMSNITSLESELSQLSMVDSFSKVEPAITKSNCSSTTDLSTSNTVPATTTTPVNIEAFFKEVQRYEKIVNNLQTKTLNGTTSLAIKWKDLNELLAKDASKRTVSVSKLFPEKNRNMLCVPYDHARVLLPTETDNYINAAHLKDLGLQFNHFILADAPTFNTIKDFWCMIWSQKSKYIISLSTAEETPNPFLPKQLNIDATFGDYTVTVLTEQNLSHCIERTVRVTSSITDSNESHQVVILLAKVWPSKSSVNNIIGISQNTIDVIQSKGEPNVGPIVLTCPTSCERCSLVALTITSISALSADAPIIINVSDIWYRICSQRKNVLSDSNVLQLSMQIVLQCGREFIKKKSLTAPSSSSTTQINYFFIEEEETAVKDPFKDLDPLWKLK